VIAVSVTPAYNESKHIADVITETKKYVTYAIVVDDCSKDNTWQKAIESNADIILISQENHGQGYSIREGMKLALLLNPDVIVTVDADMQHNPEEIPKIISPIMHDGYDVVIGSRTTEDVKDMPKVKRFGNFMLTLITRVLFGIYCSDSQSGFRAYSPKAAQLIQFKVDRYGWASVMFAEIVENHLKYREIDIDCIYHDVDKGTTIKDGLWIGAQMLHYKILYFGRKLKWDKALAKSQKELETK
jgi:glycosyltransferase involved in cell wall biosynthesis